MAFGLRELVLAELDLDRPDDRDGVDRDTGERFGRLREGREVTLTAVKD